MADSRNAPITPDLGADWMGGNVIPDNIRIIDCSNGNVITHNMAPPAITNPLDPLCISGSIKKREMREREAILKQNLDRVSIR